MQALTVLSIRDLQSLIERFDPRGDERAYTGKVQTLALLGQAEAALDRRNYAPGHVTASGIVLSPDGSHVLLVFHRRLGRWLQPGGHIEPDDRGVVEAAAREVVEETGVAPRWEVDPLLVGLDVHEIPRSEREPAHLHHDVVWRFVAATDRLGSNLASERAVWCPVDGLERYGADGPLRRSVARAVGVDSPA